MILPYNCINTVLVIASTKKDLLFLRHFFLNTFLVMFWKKIKNEIEQRAITPKVWSIELKSFSTALFLNEIYLPIKFHVDALHSFKVILRTKKGRTDWWTNRLTDWWMDGQTPSFGGINKKKCWPTLPTF